MAFLNCLSSGVPAGAVASVSLIDTTGYINNVPVDYLVGPPVENVQNLPDMPIFAFLIENSQKRKVLFDLGVRKDMQNLAPSVVASLAVASYDVGTEKDIFDILGDNGCDARDIEAIVWSHQHWDHIGDASRFPASVDLVVGPGFKEAYMPGAPARNDSPIWEQDYRGKHMVEIDFTGPESLHINELHAYDYFGDDSFYLLDGPGHAEGHLMGLVRTTKDPDTFILLAADAVHNAGEMRPSKYLPVPECIDLRYGISYSSRIRTCPGHQVAQLQIRRGRDPHEPLFDTVRAYSIPDSLDTIAKLQRMDCDKDVFLVYSHDLALRGIVDEFPETMNEWKRKGWATKLKWSFLSHFLPNGTNASFES